MNGLSASIQAGLNRNHGDFTIQTDPSSMLRRAENTSSLIEVNGRNRALKLIYTDANELRLSLKRGPRNEVVSVSLRELLRADTYRISVQWDPKGISLHLRATTDEQRTVRSSHS